jgi:amphi-Trp domain-containing protein
MFQPGSDAGGEFSFQWFGGHLGFLNKTRLGTVDPKEINPIMPAKCPVVKRHSWLKGLFLCVILRKAWYILPETEAEDCKRRPAMGKEVRLFKSEERKNRADVSAFLHQLADKVLEGQVVLRQGQEELTLQLPQSLILEVQVEDEDKKAKGIQHSLEVEIKWFDDEQGGPLELR